MLFKEFKDFAFKGNLIDVAVGIMIGGAFATVVKSLVENVFMPPLSLLTGPVNFTEKYIALNGQSYANLAAAKAASAPVLAYGQFFADILSFLILAFAVFLITKKVISTLTLRHEETAAAPVLTKDQELLVEIRDSLKNHLK